MVRCISQVTQGEFNIPNQRLTFVRNGKCLSDEGCCGACAEFPGHPISCDSASLNMEDLSKREVKWTMENPQRSKHKRWTRSHASTQTYSPKSVNGTVAVLEASSCPFEYASPVAYMRMCAPKRSVDVRL
eukprot:1005980-Pyramimonas_sp.AAC.1